MEEQKEDDAKKSEEPKVDWDEIRRHHAETGVATECGMEGATKQLKECYEKILEILRYYVDLTEDQYKIIGIWIIGTYFHEEFNTYPFLFLNAMRGSGKSKLLRLINYLSFKGRGQITNCITEATIFHHPKNIILSIDELEQIGKKENATLRELLNSAYKKGMVVKRQEKAKVDGKETYVPKEYEPYFPICLANIWGLEEVLADRALTLILEKSCDPSITKTIEDWDAREDILQLKRTLVQIYVVCVVKLRKKTYITAWNQYIKEHYNKLHYYTNYTNNTNNTNNTTTEIIGPEDIEKIDREEFFRKVDEADISGRNFELFFPLLITSKIIGDEVFEQILEISKNFVHSKRDEEFAESRDVCLYQFVAEHGIESELVPIKEFTSHFRLTVGDTQSTDEAWCNEKWVGRALKRLGLLIDKKRVASGILIRVNSSKAKEKIKMFK